MTLFIINDKLYPFAERFKLWKNGLHKQGLGFKVILSFFLKKFPLTLKLQGGWTLCFLDGCVVKLTRLNA